MWRASNSLNLLPFQFSSNHVKQIWIARNSALCLEPFFRVWQILNFLFDDPNSKYAPAPLEFELGNADPSTQIKIVLSPKRVSLLTGFAMAGDFRFGKLSYVLASFFSLLS